MSSFFGSKGWWIALFLCLVAALGFIAGHNRRRVSSTAHATLPTAVSAKIHRRADLPTQVNAKRAPGAVPAYLTSLDGKEFVDALPFLETLARGGDLDAARVIYQRLRSCVDFHANSDEEIRSRENLDYQRQIEITRRIRREYPDRPVNPPFDEASLTRAHERALKADFDQRDLCTSLAPQQVDQYLDWAQFALERQDRQMVLDATIPGEISGSGIERVRNAERLMEIADIERNDLNDLIATGDRAALERAAYAFASDSNGILPRDPGLAYMYAYALSLAGGNGNDLSQITAMMHSLASGQSYYPPLTAQQIDTARARGLALFESCCASRTHN